MTITSIVKLLEWLCDMTHDCEYAGKRFVLNSGTISVNSTGERVSHNLHDNDFQLRAMETSPYPLHEWHRYVDETKRGSSGDTTPPQYQRAGSNSIHKED